MQGSVAAFLWAQNDRKYRHAEFGKDAWYWKGRLRAAAFAWVYSTQFEIGPLSEASIGGIQASFPQQGFVDHVITPTVGMGWTVAEDVIDKFVIKRVEGATANRWIRLITRTSMNPSRTFANVLQGSAPWHRETRPGVLEYRKQTAIDVAPVREQRRGAETPDRAGPPPFEFNLTFQPERVWGAGGAITCVGGGGTAAIRVTAAWQVAVDAGGCKMLGLKENVSGDSLTYMVGPRWTQSGTGPWSGHLQFLIGGTKMTNERMWPKRKELLEEAASRKHNAPPPSHADYTDQAETNGFAISTGAGIDYKLNRALAIRVAEVSYRHSWVGPLWGRDYSNGLKIGSGLVLRMGTW
jgi:hypothetical protein